MNYQKYRVSYLAALLFIFSSSVFASAEVDFSKGVKYFKSGDYASAVVRFERAKKQGMNTLALHYNMASSYFKLAQYDKSKYYFGLVAKSAEMRHLAEYNLGLIALKENDRAAAKKIFLQVKANSKDKKLVRLSNKQLADIKSIDDKWKVYVSANIGNDDNITSTADDTVAGISDSFYDVFLSVDSLVSGKRKNGWIVDATYFKIDFSDTSTYDEYQYGVGVRRELRITDWDTSAHLKFSQNNFGGDDYQSSVKLDLKGKSSLTRTSRLYLRYRYEDITSDKAIYDYLEGWRQRARVEYRNYTKNNIQQVYYELELNDRGSLVTSLYAYDYSPTRHTIRGKYTHMFSDKWHLLGDLSYRMSDFPTSVSFNRDDDQFKASASVDYRFDKTFKLRTKLQYIDNQSTVDRYEYDKTQISVGLSKRF